MLEGTGSTQIKGLLTYSGITTHTAGTPGTNGDTFTPADVAAMESKLPDAVDAPTAWVMRKALFAALMNRRADAVSASDGKGPFLFRNTANLGTAPPVELHGTRVVRSSQVSATRAKGSATDLTYALLGFANFSSIAIQIGGISGMAPERRGDLARLGLRAMVGGNLAAFMSASLAGMLA